jgi:hypothetical protein
MKPDKCGQERFAIRSIRSSAADGRFLPVSFWTLCRDPRRSGAMGMTRMLPRGLDACNQVAQSTNQLVTSSSFWIFLSFSFLAA